VEPSSQSQKDVEADYRLQKEWQKPKRMWDRHLLNLEVVLVFLAESTDIELIS
jgi:hypothetical protein